MGSTGVPEHEQQPYITSNEKWLARLGNSLPTGLPGTARVLIAADRPRVLRDLLIGVFAGVLGVLSYGYVGPNESGWLIVGPIVIITVLTAVFLRREAASDTIYVGPGWLARRKVSGKWAVLDVRRLSEVRTAWGDGMADPRPVVLRGSSLDGQEIKFRVRSQAWDKAVRPHLLASPEVPQALHAQISKPLPLRVFGREVPETP